MANHPPGNYNPKDSKGRFTSGKQYPDNYYRKRRIQYASSDERDDALEVEERRKNSQISAHEKEAIEQANEEEIRTLLNQERYFKSKIASAFTSDDRQAYERQLKMVRNRLKKLKGGKNNGKMGDK